MHKSNGEIYAHEQDGYPDDPDKRTVKGNEHVNQARRFAKYWVARECGYDTLDWQRNPDRITAAALAIAPVTSAAAEEYFGDFAQQFAHIHGDAEPAVSVPDEIRPADVVYQKDVYVGIDEPALESLTGDLLETDEVIAALGRAIDPTETRPDGTVLSDVLADVTGIDETDVPRLHDGLLIEDVSDLHVHWDDAAGQYHTQWGEQPAIDREPNARIEIFEFDPDSLDDLTRQITRHLLCQVRDCYLRMGIAPPEPFRLLGPGHHDAGTWYEHYDFYDRYHDPTAEISTWYEEYTPDDAYGVLSTRSAMSEP
ncbi:hypothetical protein ACFR99_18495 [Haloarchaeobius amylolyticus]|uniref:Uncharacterized protein n=1 Tax=Haloarchaeobius amylolyticus TaxID=1198296 RepID=A0ABD6BKG1_9EURY